MSDREITRELAKRYSEIAALEVQKENGKLYRALNSLRPIRPVVLIDELPWNQLNKSDELKLACTDEKHRRVEGYFRSQLYRWNHFRCDMVLANHFPWPRHIAMGSFGIEIDEKILAIDEGNNIVSHKFQDRIKTEEDIARLHAPEIIINEQEDREDREWLEELLGDILPVKLKGLEYMGYFVPWDDIVRWRGVEPLLWDLADRPDFMLSLIRKLTDIRLEMMKNAEERKR